MASPRLRPPAPRVAPYDARSPRRSRGALPEKGHMEARRRGRDHAQRAGGRERKIQTKRVGQERVKWSFYLSSQVEIIILFAMVWREQIKYSGCAVGKIDEFDVLETKPLF